MFGKTLAQQLRRWEDEKHAYYDLVKISSIKSLAHMCPVFEDRPDWYLDGVNGVNTTSTWLQTVTVC